MNRRRLLCTGLAACALTAPFAVSAQGTYPSQTIRIIVPQPPGGGFDSVARQVSERMTPLLGQPMVIENKPGSGTVVGTDAAAKATADGYTLLLGAISNMALNPGLYAKLPYDPSRDFKPVGLAVSYAYTLIARKDLPFKTLQDVIAYARDNPEKLTYASAGNGSGQHVAAAVLFQAAKVKVQHIPYRGAQPAYQDIIGGRVDLLFDIVPTAKVQIDAGTVKPLAVSSATRQPSLPEVPTVLETGLAPLDMESWFGLFAPAATPEPILTRLRTDFAKGVQQPEVAEKFKAQGGRALAMNAADTDAFIRAELAKWPKLVRETGIALD